MALKLGWLACRGDELGLGADEIVRSHAYNGWLVAVLRGGWADVRDVAWNVSNDNGPTIAFFVYNGRWSTSVWDRGVLIGEIDRHEQRPSGDLLKAAQKLGADPGLLRAYANAQGKAFDDDEFEIEHEMCHVHLAKRLGIAFEQPAH